MVEGNGCQYTLLFHILQYVIDQDSLTASSSSNQHNRALPCHEEVQEISQTHSLSSVDKNCLQKQSMHKNIEELVSKSQYRQQARATLRALSLPKFHIHSCTLMHLSAYVDYHV